MEKKIARYSALNLESLIIRGGEEPQASPHLCLSLICSWKELVSSSGSELGRALSTGAAES